MKTIFIMILSSLSAFGSEIKSQHDLPKGALGSNKLLVDKIRAIPWDSGEVTLRFDIKGDIDSSKIIFRCGFSRSKDHPSSLSILIKRGDESSVYEVTQGSEFAKNLAGRITAVPREKGDDGYNRREYDESRVGFLKQLLNGTYSWRKPPPF